jgi:hypothetical protein
LAPSDQAFAQERLFVAPVVSSATLYWALGADVAVVAATVATVAATTATSTPVAFTRGLCIDMILSVRK